MERQIAFIVLLAAPMLLIIVPMVLAYRKDRRAKRAALGRSTRS